MIPFTDEELSLIAQALDSHRYWQVADDYQRSEGAVVYSHHDDNYEELQECDRLMLKVEKERQRRFEAKDKEVQ